MVCQGTSFEQNPASRLDRNMPELVTETLGIRGRKEDDSWTPPDFLPLVETIVDGTTEQAGITHHVRGWGPALDRMWGGSDYDATTKGPIATFDLGGGNSEQLGLSPDIPRGRAELRGRTGERQPCGAGGNGTDELGHGAATCTCSFVRGGGCHHFRSNTGDGVTKERRVMTQLKLRQRCEAKFKQKCSESSVSVISERVTFNARVCEMAAGDTHEATR